MLKKIIASAVLCAGAALYAYNPPAGGQNLLRISSPELLSEGASAAGGAFDDSHSFLSLASFEVF